ncbi:MAG: hypothetical protein SGI90_14050 [Candidatus Eisenbacteria bacterium]|nr:hypothetical protein [Candidatus Eisenbacteria bacterium]
MSYARARLWLGIATVGTLTLAASLALVSGLPGRLLDHQGFLYDLRGLAFVLLGYVAISAPFDWIGGFILPRRHGRSHATEGRFGAPGGIFGFTALSIGLLAFQFPLARIVGGFGYQRGGKDLPGASVNRAHGRDILMADARDEGFVGGLIGLPGLERLVLPKAWLHELKSDELAIQLARREAALATGSRLRGVILALAWNVAGFILSARLTGSDTGTLSGLVTTAIGFTLWSFIGLLLLPTPSRAGVFEVDHAIGAKGFSPFAVERLLRILDARQDGEPDRPAGVEMIFHPVPALGSRLASMRRAKAGNGCWHAARMVLPLSWAGLGFLSRAVHCNCGRPELWVLLPGD